VPDKGRNQWEEREKHPNQIPRIKKGGVPLMPTNLYKKKAASFTVGYSFNNLEDKKEGIDLYHV
jgi:hypothetical protein